MDGFATGETRRIYCRWVKKAYNASKNQQNIGPNVAENKHLHITNSF